MTPGDTPELVAAEFATELSAIAGWWLEHARDPHHGGVHGEIAGDNTIRRDAHRGAILQARVLWFFSELARARPDSGAGEAARSQYRYLLEHFDDVEHGGLVWSVAPSGEWVSDRKQVYVQAFAIYAFSAYAIVFGDGEALARALDLARFLEERAWDSQREGYVEAFSRDWRPIEDVRLSERDLDAPKTMNTHLHVLEACTALHRAAGQGFTKALLERNVALFLERFVRPRGRHLTLFYSMAWDSLCGDESYGHDIEASWLLCEAADALGDAGRAREVHAVARTLADAVLDVALDADGGIAYERLPAGLIRERHWWPQTEALVGFYNAYELTGDGRFREASARVWEFVKRHQIDREHGEWRWLSDLDAPARGPYKAGFWKGPYHNGRAMMEMMRRLAGP